MDSTCTDQLMSPNYTVLLFGSYLTDQPTDSYFTDQRMDSFCTYQLTDSDCTYQLINSNCTHHLWGSYLTDQLIGSYCTGQFTGLYCADQKKSICVWFYVHSLFSHRRKLLAFYDSAGLVTVSDFYFSVIFLCKNAGFLSQHRFLFVKIWAFYRNDSFMWHIKYSLCF